MSDIRNTAESAIFSLGSSVTLIYKLAFCGVISYMEMFLSSLTLFLGKIERHCKCLFYVAILHLK